MAKSTRNEETQMAQTFKQQLEAAGFKTVTDNHWIFSERLGRDPFKKVKRCGNVTVSA